MPAAPPKTSRPRSSEPRFRTWGYDNNYSPNGNTRLLLGQIAAVLDEYHEHLPLTIRQIYYRLVGRGELEKTVPAYQRLKGHISSARRGRWVDPGNGRAINFDVIRDDGIVDETPSSYTGSADFWSQVRWQADDYRLDRQSGQPQFIEVWCETVGMVPQLARVAGEYGVPVLSSGGTVSITGTRQAGLRASRRDVPTLILHAGDHDPTGVMLYESLRDDTAAFCRDEGGGHGCEVRRIALVESQLSALESNGPPPAKDPRTPKWRLKYGPGDTTYQLEAMAPGTLTAIVADVLDGLIDADAYAQVLETEGSDLGQIREQLAELT